MFCVGLLMLAGACSAENVRINCDSENLQLVITSVEGGSGIQMGEVIDLWSLVRVQDDQVVDTRAIERNCQLADEVYRVIVQPIPGNYNVQGRCGAEVFAGVEIYRGQKAWGEYAFKEDCHDSENAIQEVRIHAGAEAPVVMLQK